MKLMQVLEDTRREIDKCYFTLCFELNSGLPLGISTLAYKDVAESIGAAFGQMIDIVMDGQKHARNPAVREVLKEFKEFILETSESTFFMMVPENNNTVAIAVGVPKEIKLGYARVTINKFYPKIIECIKEMV